MKHRMIVEYLKYRADLNIEVDFRVNDAIGTIATKWDLISFEKLIVFIHITIIFRNPTNIARNICV